MAKEIIISPKGEIRTIYSPETDAILRGVAAKSGTTTETRRASHVEPSPELSNRAILWLALYHPTWKDELLPKMSDKVVALTGPVTLSADVSATDAVGILLRPYLPQDKWWADLLISEGPVLGPFDTREIALKEEADWLIAHHIPVCDPCRGVNRGKNG